MTGVFDSAYGWNISDLGQTPRCSTNFYPKTDPPFDIQDIFSGYSVHVPGRGTSSLMGEPNASHRPSDGQTRLWLTRELDSFSCTPMAGGYPGEGFVMLTTAGVKYTFNVGTVRYAGSMGRNSGVMKRARIQVYLLASRIEDRFGNYVDYTYDGNGHPTQIASKDGRIITLAYTDGRLTSAAAHGRQWSYEYVGNRLSRVVLPDQSAWAFSHQSDMKVFYGMWDGAGCDGVPLPLKEFGLTLTHPSGAVGVFNFEHQRHFRSGVPAMSCVVTTEPGSSVTTSSLAIPYFFDAFSIVSKEISGPGLPLPSRWTYAEFSDDVSLWSGQVPPCLSCQPSKLVVQTMPDGSKVNETYGIVFGHNEGKLLSTQVISQSNEVLNTESLVYLAESEVSSQPFPSLYGTDYGPSDPSVAKIRPLRSRTISRQGVNFTWRANTFDVFARPLSVTKSSTLPGNPTRTDVTTYEDHPGKWVLGQVKQVRTQNLDDTFNVVLSRTEYDPTTALPLHHYSADTAANGGILQQSLTYNADGTISTVKDGNTNTISLSSWYRGIPQQVQFPPTPEAPGGTSQSIAVNPSGWITSVTDVNSFTTTYQHDFMGRVTSVTYPADDSTNWNTTTQTFEQVADVEYGISAGHWRQTITTGNAKKINYFDAQWRPVVTREFDVANEAGTKRFQRFAYDYDGRVTFSSYPGTNDALNTGVWTIYDALGRATSVSQDSELGLLTSLMHYQNGFTTLSTTPRTISTTASYLAYDQPTTELPLAISQSGISTQIARDLLGKPTSITRGGGGLSVARNYVYDRYQRLCKTIEPEAGATVMSYDNAGNVVWTASGQTYPSATDCDTANVAQNQKVVRNYDSHNRLSSLVFPDGNGNQNWNYTKDGLPATVTTFNEAGASTVSNSYAYNKRRMLTGESVVVGTNIWSLGAGYNGNGHVAFVTLPAVGLIDYAPNALGQPTQAGSYASGVSYYPNGAIKQFMYGNGISHDLTQNSRGLPQRSWDAGASTVHDNSLSYDQVGNVIGIVDGLPSARGNRSMIYDDFDRLTRTESPMFGVAEYGYNALDDLVTTKVTGGSSPRDHAYVYDANRLLVNVKEVVGGASVVGLSYDERGNLRNKNGVLYQFDFGNRLRGVSNLEDYQYDSYGRRVKAVRGAAGIYSFYDQAGVLRFQRDETAGKNIGYVHLGGSLVARVTDPIPLSLPTLVAPGYSSSGSYTASWTAVSLATRYELQERIGAGAWVLIQDTAAVSRAFSGKAANSYDYRVRGCSAATCGNWSAVVTVMVELAPASAPSLSVPTSGLNGGYTVSWGSVAAASSYVLQQSFNGGAWTDVYTGAAFSKVFSGQGAGSYSYAVKACNPAGCGPNSNVGTVSVINPPASAPALSVPASSYSGSYSVSWGGVASATRYELVEQVNGGGWTLVQNAALVSMSFSGKYAGSWGYQVRACNAAGCGSYSPTGTVLVTLPPASAPGLTVPAGNYTGSFVVSWNGIGAATHYELEQQLNGGAWNLAQSSPATSKTVVVGDAGLWGYRVRACNVAGCSNYSNVENTQVAFPPASSPALTVPASSPSGLYSISWSGVATATSYELQEQIGGGAWTTVLSAASTGYSPPTKPNGTYGYRVRACNAAGCSAYSAVQAIVVQLLTPGVPTGLTVTQQSATACRIKWNAVAGASNYMVDMAETTVTVPGTQYFWDAVCPYPIRVAACNSYGCSAWAQ